jgi:hypothetical protein
LPRHLTLCVAFLETVTNELCVRAELKEDFGHGRVVIQYWVARCLPTAEPAQKGF